MNLKKGKFKLVNASGSYQLSVNEPIYYSFSNEVVI